MKIPVREEKGVAIITVLLIMLTLVIITPVLFHVAATEGLLSARHTDFNKSYYVARSGAEIGVDYINRNFCLQETDDLRSEEKLQKLVNDLEGMEIEVGEERIEKIEGNVYERNVIIEVTGNVNETRSIVAVNLRVPRTLFDYAIFGVSEEKPIDIGRVGIDAEIGSNHEVEWSSSVDPPDEYEEYAGITEEDLFVIEEALFPCGEQDPVDVPPIITEEEYYQAIDKNVVIDTNGEELHIRTEAIDIGGDDIIEAIGEGIVHIFIEESFTIGGNAQIISGDTDVIIYLDNGEINIEARAHGGPTIEAFIYGPGASFDWQGGANQTITGGIICYDFLVAGGSNTAKIEFDPLLQKGSFENIDEILEEAYNFIVTWVK